MGRQINFYMTEIDEVAFLEYLRSLAETRLDRECLDPATVIDPNAPGGPLPSGHFSYWLWRPGQDPPPMRHESGLRCVEVRSQAVQFSRTGCGPERPLRGRLWIDTFEPRPDHFVKWYGQLASWIRKRYRRDRFGDYWGPDAEARWADQLEPPQ